MDMRKTIDVKSPVVGLPLGVSAMLGRGATKQESAREKPVDTTAPVRYPVTGQEATAMRSTITISVPEAMRSELDRLSRSDGVSRSDLVRESLRDYLFLRRFRSMRKSMVSKAAARGVYTDQDVFDQVS